MTKVLQIIHIADLHVWTESSHIRKTAAQSRKRTRLKQSLAQSLPGRQGQVRLETDDVYIQHGPGEFSSFLQELRGIEPEWFDSTPTWILDTGDLTAFGDEDSIRAGKKMLKEWADLIGAQVLSLYGNQDAHVISPSEYFSDLAAQHARLAQHEGWKSDQWIARPLRAPIPIKGNIAHLELYGLDTVAWEGIYNSAAIGKIDPADIAALERFIKECRARGGTRDYRILATHHPISFPYAAVQPVGCNDDRSMRLDDAIQVAKSLGPYIDLIVSGHVHRRYPGGAINSGTGDFSIDQEGLASGTLQLTGGPLMLNADLPGESESRVAGFSPVVLDNGNSQADILRFSMEPHPSAPLGAADTLMLHRLPIAGSAGMDYIVDASREQIIPVKRF
jgi:3',5'-cyclic AMP phosphodiesterase CpdA